MALGNDIEAVIEHVKGQKANLGHNQTLFNIYEGDLLTYVENDLRNELSPASFAQARPQIAGVFSH